MRDGGTDCGKLRYECTANNGERVRAREEAASRKRSSGESSARGTTSLGRQCRLVVAARMVYTRHRAQPRRAWFWFWLNLFDLLLLLDHRRLRNWAAIFRLVRLLLFPLSRSLCVVGRDALFLRSSSALALLDLVPQGLEVVCGTRQAEKTILASARDWKRVAVESGAPHRAATVRPADARGGRGPACGVRAVQRGAGRREAHSVAHEGDSETYSLGREHRASVARSQSGASEEEEGKRRMDVRLSLLSRAKRDGSLQSGTVPKMRGHLLQRREWVARKATERGHGRDKAG